ncbi:MAG TPA: hypothetical protein PKH40_07090 [Treponemataceae bacterium]|jgi:tetratricopeptide (TPR) repeat protein|nr:hypothetical protein [Treponemataceae bacterium]HPX47852.1 hypothetical protein [Treponemataceae bacterium]HQL33912.1 hypothetical protein [Treponemataceae bacterium]
MPTTVLERARRAFFRKRYHDVITLLEPNILQYKDSFQFYMCLALACLYSGDIGGATSYFQRARQIKMRDPDLLAAQAALFLRRGDTHQAVEYYLEALEYAPEHRLAKKSLNFIRKHGDPETISAMVETGRIIKFYPRLKKNFSLRQTLTFMASIIILCILGIVSIRVIASRMELADRADLAHLELSGTDKKTSLDIGGSYRYILTEKEILSSYQKAQQYFQNWRDNVAQKEINRILLSNASAGIKQKTRLLMTYLSEPGFDTLKDRFDYQEILADPPLYQDCWVIWNGMATNIVSTDNTMEFDFLVGYDMRNNLQGIVPVRVSSVLTFDTGRSFELLGKVSFDNGVLVLKGRSVYQSVVRSER